MAASGAIRAAIVMGAGFLSSAGPVVAQINGNGVYKADLRLRTGFEQVSVEELNGETYRNSTWMQQVFSSASGPLGSPWLGLGSASFEYASGDDASRVVQGVDPARRLVGFGLSGQLLPAEVRRYFNINPSYRRTENRMEWGGMPGDKYRDTTVGGSAGLTLPGFPSLNVTYNDVMRRDDAEAQSSFNQDILSVRQRSSYVRGPFRWQYDRQIHDIDKPAGTAGDRRVDTTISSADLNYYGIKRLGIKDVFARISYNGSEVSNYAGSDTSRRAAENVHVTSESVRRWGINFFARAGQSLTTDFGGRGTKLGNDLALYSRYSGGRWNVENRTQYINSPDRSDSVGNRINVGSNWLENMLRHSFQGEETYLWGGGRGSAMREALLQRIALYPDRRFDIYVKHSYDGERKPGGETSSRRLTLGGGGGVYPVSEVSAGLDYERSRLRSQAGAPRTVSDRIAMSVRSQPLNRLKLRAAYVFSRYEYIATSAGQRSTGSLTADCSYVPIPGLTARVRINRAARSSGSLERTPFDIAVSSDYRVGRSLFSAVWESRELSAPRKYRRFNISMTRDF